MSTVSLLHWRPHTETPDALHTPALIAVFDPDDDEVCLTYSVHDWNGEHWVDEVDGRVMDHAIYYWLPEIEVIAPLRALHPAQADELAEVAHG
ncbi:MAG: hypothetical protein KDI42_11225 [Gammaproteobacteria bacterium]|nr:hypothetical protein [Gammaproteobacteria bacterium]